MEQEIITSRQNKNVVELCKLSERKEREKNGLFRIDGIKLLKEAILQNITLEKVFLKAENATEIAGRILMECHTKLENIASQVLVLDNLLFDKASEENAPEGVICTAKYIDNLQKNIKIYNILNNLNIISEKIAILESVRDPANMGAIIRSAAAFGYDRLIVSKDCADIYNPKTIRASMGALFSQRIDRVENLPNTIQTLVENGRKVYAAVLDPDAISLDRFQRTDKDIVVIGNEGHGISQEVKNACTNKIYIPMSGRTESLNAAVAASVLMWEFSKK